MTVFEERNIGKAILRLGLPAMLAQPVVEFIVMVVSIILYFLNQKRENA